MKNSFRIVFLVLFLFLITACGSTSNDDDNSTSKEDDGYKLAELHLYNKNDEFNGKYTYSYNSKGDTTRQ